MQFISTRGECDPLSFSEAVATGLAPDGGLYVPEDLPDISTRLADWATLPYPRLCEAFFGLFADIPAERLADICDRSYATFDHLETAPVISLRDNLAVLELFHGPTLAFKDFALQLLGNIYEEQMKATGQTINVLGATSGDTGAAAIHGLLGKAGVRIFILYPNGRVAPLQERQMTCTGSETVFAMAIEGSFDDAQRALKELFADQAFRLGNRLSAVNSINLARVLAQCVYYLYAWLRLPKANRGNVEFVVPTGNFGNVLAGWMARQMGLPVQSFRVATNQNDILHRLFQTGRYEVGDVLPSLAPSMDIQVASNFERFLYFAEGRNPAKVREIMAAFKDTGRYHFADFDPDAFTSSRTTDAQIPEIIQRIYRDFGYVCDPHTACGFAENDPDRLSVVLATAHPAKFPDTIEAAIGIHPTAPRLEALKQRPVEKHAVSADRDAIAAFIREHAI